MLLRSLMLVLVVLLSGCAGKTLTKNLPHLVGKDIDYAVGILGAPSKVTEYESTRFVSWSVNHRGSMILPTTNTSTTSGYVGSMPVYGSTTTTGTQVVPTNAVCTVTLHVQSGVVTRWEWRGNEYGCEQFADRVKHLSK